ncbi:hypothetical protein DERP_011736 [Dermatophagoides pteronyssinus]|uniref:Uncharacterized protein n=1 Tax=Dermatophagoides pteronyssinus TaxID=6956 RepID=A0ABQ8J358_DERPT|nr:hypothetical protein DERP_011736 [Dermatophagoides pteronyssinus]
MANNNNNNKSESNRIQKKIENRIKNFLDPDNQSSNLNGLVQMPYPFIRFSAKITHIPIDLQQQQQQQKTEQYCPFSLVGFNQIKNLFSTFDG